MSATTPRHTAEESSAATPPGVSETGARRGLGPWPARCALVAAAGLVVGGIAYGTLEVVSALSPAASTGSPESAGTEERGSGGSERRTVSLLPDAAEEEAAPEPAVDPGGAGVAGQAPGGGGEADGAGTSGGTPAFGGGGGAPGDGVDPRREILEGILNSPQPRPPLEPLVTQEDIDAEREALEAEALGSQGGHHGG